MSLSDEDLRQIALISMSPILQCLLDRHHFTLARKMMAAAGQEGVTLHCNKQETNLLDETRKPIFFVRAHYPKGTRADMDFSIELYTSTKDGFPPT